LLMPIQEKELSNEIIRTFYHVYNELGYGFLEKVYHNALLFALSKKGYQCESKKKVVVYFEGMQVGEYYPDLIINNSIILEIKTSEGLSFENECQLINYLRATDIEIGLLLNFGKKPEFRRKFYTNDRKRIRIDP
jgi:GxxExxY protein